MKQIKAYILATLIAVAPATIFTACSDSAADEAEALREELRSNEAITEQDRQNRERANDVRLNEIKNEQRLTK
jgi:hypothetical protein